MINTSGQGNTDTPKCVIKFQADSVHLDYARFVAKGLDYARFVAQGLDYARFVAKGLDYALFIAKGLDYARFVARGLNNFFLKDRLIALQLCSQIYVKTISIWIYNSKVSMQRKNFSKIEGTIFHICRGMYDLSNLKSILA